MRIGPYILTLSKKATPPLAPLTPSSAGWWPLGVVRESFAGAWQQNVELRADTALSYYAVYACLRLISTDMGKMFLALVEEVLPGIWERVESPAFSPVLRKPNRYQTINKFVESWILSKLMHGNAYVLLDRDQRNVVIAMHVLEPARVTPLVTRDGAVYYEVKRDDLSGLEKDIPYLFRASDVIHDTYIAPFHPLIGLSPIYACGLSASQGLTIQNNSKNFFTNGANPGGMLTAPGAISDETAARLLATVNSKKAGDTLVGGDGLKFEKFTMTAVDAQMIEQLRMTAEQVCSAFGVPPYLVDIGPPPPYANFEPLLLKYHSQCIQSLATNLEKSLDKGLGLTEKIEGRQLGTEFDIDDLIWMDTATRGEAATKAEGKLAINEIRKKYYGAGPVKGGDSPMVQQQNFSLQALAERDADKPFSKPAPAPSPAADPEEPEDMPAEDMTASFAAILHRKSLEAELYAA
jgi:HK97 family phage portal protein